MPSTVPYHTCSILVADDHVVVRRGLRQVIAEECCGVVVEEASTRQGPLDAVRRLDCAVVVLDINLPDKNGLEMLNDLKAMRPALPVLILSHHAETEYAARAFKAGAAGYPTKESASEELAVAIHKVLAGGRYVSPSFAEHLTGEPAPCCIRHCPIASIKSYVRSREARRSRRSPKRYPQREDH
jgi:two-component system, NarL family, invasion response regulator UvrY